jgi:hypothetical protein
LLHPVYTITGAVVVCINWCVQAVFWSMCYDDYSYDKVVCPETPLALVLHSGVATARLVFAI